MTDGHDRIERKCNMTMVWCRPGTVKGTTRADISDEWFEFPVSRLDFEPLDRPFPNVTLEITTKHPPNDTFEPGDMHIVSDRMKAALEEFKVLAEFFPVRVVHRGEEYTDRF